MSESGHRSLMVIDYDPGRCRLMVAVAAREGWRPLVVRDASAAVAIAAGGGDSQVGALVLDMGETVPGSSGLLGELRARGPAMSIVALASGNDTGMDALRCGASDFLVKPLKPQNIIRALRNAAARDDGSGWPGELAPLAEKPETTDGFDAMIGSSPARRSMLALAAKAARGHGSVLVEGEAGTGKDSLIRAIHAASTRADGPLRFVNAGAISASALESELFGHEKDAFPGAFEHRAGAIRQSEGGTLVIDEIEALTPKLQDRLLDLLRSGNAIPVGSRRAYRADFRLITASNTGLRMLAAQGRFRQELLDVISHDRIALPPLRERAGDIPDLARHFLACICKQAGRRELGITEGALALLSGYEWPGNLRQLQSTLLRVCASSDRKVLTADDFPGLVVGSDDFRTTPFVQGPQHTGGNVTLYTPDGDVRPLEEIESDVIRLAVGHYHGRMTEVARRLGIGRSTLYRKLGDLGIDNAA